MPLGSLHAKKVLLAPGRPLFGSSMIRSASDQPPAKMRLVTAVLKKRAMFTEGTGELSGVIVPPVQVKVISPACSAKPSARREGVTDTLVVQVVEVIPRTVPARAIARSAKRTG